MRGREGVFLPVPLPSSQVPQETSPGWPGRGVGREQPYPSPPHRPLLSSPDPHVPSPSRFQESHPPSLTRPSRHPGASIQTGAGPQEMRPGEPVREPGVRGDRSGWGTAPPAACAAGDRRVTLSLAPPGRTPPWSCLDGSFDVPPQQLGLPGGCLSQTCQTVSAGTRLPPSRAPSCSPAAAFRGEPGTNQGAWRRPRWSRRRPGPGAGSTTATPSLPPAVKGGSGRVGSSLGLPPARSPCLGPRAEPRGANPGGAPRPGRALCCCPAQPGVAVQSQALPSLKLPEPGLPPQDVTSQRGPATDSALIRAPNVPVPLLGDACSGGAGFVSRSVDVPPEQRREGIRCDSCSAHSLRLPLRGLLVKKPQSWT